MGKLPPIDTPGPVSLEIPVAAHFLDHRFEGRAVLPAVTSMELLARAVAGRFPDCRIHTLTDVRFDKFLPLSPEVVVVPATAEITISDGGDPEATLITRTRAPKAAITRAMTHARVRFSQAAPVPPVILSDVAAAPEGICHRIPAYRVYQELVPFGPSYRNIQGDMFLSPDGALARIVCPGIEPAGGPALLGSPFALDAAFHAACAWGQRFVGVVGFPMAVAERSVFLPTKPGEICFARVFPKQASRELLLFDILLMDPDGRLRESARGVAMRDPSGGRLTPPDWIMVPPGEEDPFKNLREGCDVLTVVELDAPSDFAPTIFSSCEGSRFEKMGHRRGKSFLAARLALKRMYRKWAQSTVPAPEIETVLPDDPRPLCRVSGQPGPDHVSVSHDARFAVAVCAGKPVGVDVETLSERCLRADRIFMSEQEKALCRSTTLGAVPFAVRIWSVKEAVSKALDMPLAEAWHQVEVTAVDRNESRLEVEGRPAPPVRHAEVSGHLFTLFSLSSPPGR